MKKLSARKLYSSHSPGLKKKRLASLVTNPLYTRKFGSSSGASSPSKKNTSNSVLSPFGKTLDDHNEETFKNIRNKLNFEITRNKFAFGVRIMV